MPTDYIGSDDIDGLIEPEDERIPMYFTLERAIRVRNSFTRHIDEKQAPIAQALSHGNNASQISDEALHHTDNEKALYCAINDQLSMDLYNSEEVTAAIMGKVDEYIKNLPQTKYCKSNNIIFK